MRFLKLGVLMFATAFAGNAWAQGFPTKPLRIIVPFAPGGATDYMGRMVAARMAESIGQPVIVDNRPGANAILGTDLVAKAPPDGHMLVLCAFGHATNPFLVQKLPYDTLKDLAPVTLLVTGPLMLVANPAVPANSVKELISFLKANPNKLNFGSGGIGSSQHFAAELFMSMSGTRMTHIAYKGTAPAYPDLLAGSTHLLFDNLVTALPQVKAGKLKALAVSTAERAPQAPEVPTVAESGLPGFETGIWHGFLTTGGTPKSAIARLHKEIVRVIQLPEVKEQFVARGLNPVGNTPEEFDAFIRSEMAKWSKIIKEAGIKAE